MSDYCEMAECARLQTIQVRILDSSKAQPAAFYRFRLADGSWPNAWFRVDVSRAREWLADERAIFAGPDAPVVRVIPAPPVHADDTIVRHIEDGAHAFRPWADAFSQYP